MIEGHIRVSMTKSFILLIDGLILNMFRFSGYLRAFKINFLLNIIFLDYVIIDDHMMMLDGLLYCNFFSIEAGVKGLLGSLGIAKGTLSLGCRGGHINFLQIFNILLLVEVRSVLQGAMADLNRGPHKVILRW